MFVRVWRFTVKPGHEEEFVRMNGPEGDWAHLFSRAEGYLGTTLEPVVGAPGTYRTRDSWRSPEHFAAFLAAFGDAYRALDAAAEASTAEETLEFEGLAPDPPAGP
jgi:heme-degrading monooxygenase HmoA